MQPPHIAMLRCGIPDAPDPDFAEQVPSENHIDAPTFFGKMPDAQFL